MRGLNFGLCQNQWFAARSVALRKLVQESPTGSFLVLLRLPIVDIFCGVMVEKRKDFKKYTIMRQAYKDPRVGVEELEQLYTFLRNFGVNISRCGVARDLVKWLGTCRYRSHYFIIRSRVMLCKRRTGAW